MGPDPPIESSDSAESRRAANVPTPPDAVDAHRGDDRAQPQMNDLFDAAEVAAEPGA